MSDVENARPARRARRLMCLIALILSFALPAAAETRTADAIGGFLERIRQLDVHVPEVEPGDLACRSERDAVADRVFQLHTQLMVASLACSAEYDDEQSYDRYRLFTQKHADLLRRSRATLENALPGNPEEAFDVYRTELANSESNLINAFSTLSYCRMRQARFESLIHINPDVFPSYARELALRDRIYKAC